MDLFVDLAIPNARSDDQTSGLEGTIGMMKWAVTADSYPFLCVPSVVTCELRRRQPFLRPVCATVAAPVDRFGALWGECGHAAAVSEATSVVFE